MYVATKTDFIPVL